MFQLHEIAIHNTAKDSGIPEMLSTVWKRKNKMNFSIFTNPYSVFPGWTLCTEESMEYPDISR
jgi:hypothetical protein